MRKVIRSLLLYALVINLAVLKAQESPPELNLKTFETAAEGNVTVPVVRMTEKERFEIKKPEVGTLVYQTDNLSGLFYYSEEGWRSIPADNKMLISFSVCPKVTVVDTVQDLTGLFESCGQDITTAIVLGYHEKHDGGGGVFAYNASRDGETDGGLIFDGWERTLVDRSINVKWFGAIANNVPGDYTFELIANNNTAFQKALLAVQENLQSGPSSTLFTNTATLGVFIPSGEYVLGANGLFNGINNGPGNNDPDEFDVVTRHITYFSDGNAVLAFTNTGANEYAFRNENIGSFITFRDITFVGAGGIENGEVNNSTNFIFSDSQGNVHDYYFDRCTFLGGFNRVFTVRGSPNAVNNSEWGFFKCSFLAATNVILDIEDSNQFTNYWFDQTKFWMPENSQVLRVDKGGHFKFVDCDWSGISPSQETYLFELNNDEDDNYGTNDFRIINGRFEMKTPQARVMKSNWNSGNIEISADFGSQVFQPFFQNNVNGGGIKHFEFNLKQNSSVNISFDNSVMMGYHEYSYTDNSFEGTARASYKNCSFPVRNKLDGFIRIDENGHFNKSGISFVEIENAVFSNLFLSGSIGQNHNLQIPSVHYLPTYSNRGLKKKMFKIGDSRRGTSPAPFQRFILNFPEEAESIITKVKWFFPFTLGATNTDTVSFVLRDLNNNEIASVSFEIGDGTNKEQDVFVNVKDLPEGKLILSTDNFLFGDTLPPDFFCLIEYF